jgi:hypothetical protein
MTATADRPVADVESTTPAHRGWQRMTNANREESLFMSLMIRHIPLKRQILE